MADPNLRKLVFTNQEKLQFTKISIYEPRKTAIYKN